MARAATRSKSKVKPDEKPEVEHHEPRMRQPEKAKPGKAPTLDWKVGAPGELEATMPDGTLLRIKQSKDPKMFWYCHHGHRYLGVEHTLELAKSRAICGRLRMPGESLGEWLEEHGADLPDDLREAEQARYEAWKKNPQPRPSLTQPAPALPLQGRGGSGRASGAAAATEGSGANPRGSGRAAAGAGAGPAARQRSGKPSPSAVVRVVRREPTGKPGTKWRQRQESVFASDGKTVADIHDNDAVLHMLRDGTIRLEEK